MERTCQAVDPHAAAAGFYPLLSMGIFSSGVSWLCWSGQSESRKPQSHKCLYTVFLSSLRGWKGALGMVITENKSEINVNLIARRCFIYYIFSVSNSELRETTKNVPTKLKENQQNTEKKISEHHT